jgi:hypothetical protein
MIFFCFSLDWYYIYVESFLLNAQFYFHYCNNVNFISNFHYNNKIMVMKTNKKILMHMQKKLKIAF